MAKNKRQHYVPQHYLKGFSQDGESFYRYNLKTKESSQKSIKNSCQISHFYGEEDEKVLQKIESKQAPVLRKIIDAQKLELLTSVDFSDLRYFLLLQYTRTKDSKERANKMFDKMASEFMKSMSKSDKELKKKGYTNEYIDSCTFQSPEFYKTGMNSSSFGSELIKDLEPVLIINETDKMFICGDAPVVLYNYKKIKNRSTIGLQSKGLQIFCPLTKNILILLIDTGLYDLIRDDSSSIFINKDSDVNSLNKLQISNCLDHVFFPRKEDIDYVRNLHLEIENLIKEKEARLEQENNNYKLKLSFIKLNRLSSLKYKRLVKNSSIKNLNSELLRNKELFNLYN